jgi:hypothetical protein
MTDRELVAAAKRHGWEPMKQAEDNAIATVAMRAAFAAGSEQAEAARDRYKAALEEIADKGNRHFNVVGIASALTDLARAALEAGDGEGGSDVG